MFIYVSLKYYKNATIKKSLYLLSFETDYFQKKDFTKLFTFHLFPFRKLTLALTRLELEA